MAKKVKKMPVYKGMKDGTELRLGNDSCHKYVTAVIVYGNDGSRARFNMITLPADVATSLADQLEEKGSAEHAQYGNTQVLKIKFIANTIKITGMLKTPGRSDKYIVEIPISNRKAVIDGLRQEKE